jgi:hypothetical protein
MLLSFLKPASRVIAAELKPGTAAGPRSNYTYSLSKQLVVHQLRRGNPGNGYACRLCKAYKNVIYNLGAELPVSSYTTPSRFGDKWPGAALANFSPITAEENLND